MKTRFLGIVFAIGLMLIPALASASPMDGTYIGAGSVVTGFGTMNINNYTAVIGADPSQYAVDYTNAYLPSADDLPLGDLANDGFTVWQSAPSVISFSGTLAEFNGTGTLSFFDLDPIMGYMTAVLSASGISSLFGTFTADATLYKQAATPIPGAIWLLGSGVIGLVGLRRRARRA
jgi:hypothetical protein